LAVAQKGYQGLLYYPDGFLSEGLGHLRITPPSPPL
jgi:hypothetical protein